MSEAARRSTGSGAPHPRPPEVEADTAERGEPETSRRPGEPGCSSQVTGVEAIEHAAAPTLSFGLRRRRRLRPRGLHGGLSVQIQIEPAKRSYDVSRSAKLTELFGDPHRWSVGAANALDEREPAAPLVHGAAPAREIEVLCNYDVELAAAKYFHSVTDGEVPLAFHFNGSVYYSGDDGRLQVVQVPWDTLGRLRDAGRRSGRR